MADKIIVTNESALKGKYGSAIAAIRAAIADLIQADKQRGLKTILIALDDSSSVTPAVKNPGNAQQAKKAIDAVYKKYAPDYLVILGAGDVVPQVPFRNPVYSPGDDDDKTAPSDLPYACDAPYSTTISDFLGPTRVVGRLPDLAKGTDPAYLIGLLKTASTWKTRSAADYQDYFGITASVWKGSTGKSLQKIFGNSTDLKLCPPGGPSWPPASLKRRAHFINCHGSPRDPQFYGQKGDNYPVSDKASYLPGKITEGTVAAVECCYGAELYDPQSAAGQMGICSTYLGQQAYGYLGSTTIAYGPADDNGSADLICQYFLRSVLAGASTGRAALEARQKFIQGSGQTSPMDLKTIGQYVLLGDPSVQPVETPAPHGLTTKALVAATNWSPKAARAERRQRLFARGRTIENTQSFAAAKPTKPSSAIAKQLAALAKRAGMKPSQMMTFEVRTPAAKSLVKSMPKAMKAKAPDAAHFHVVFGKKKRDGRSAARGKVMVVRTVDGSVVQVEQLYLKR